MLHITNFGAVHDVNVMNLFWFFSPSFVLVQSKLKHGKIFIVM